MRKHLPLNHWPEADHEALAAAYASADFFDDTCGPGSHLADGTRRIIRIGYRRWLGFLQEADGDPGSVRDKLRELEQRKSEISAELATRRGNMKIEVHPNLHELYRRKVSNLRPLLENETTRPQAVETIRSLIDRIEISPGLRRGRCEVLITGALAKILDFVQARTSADTQVGTFLMVAGVGFEPTTFRL